MLSQILTSSWLASQLSTIHVMLFCSNNLYISCFLLFTCAHIPAKKIVSSRENFLLFLNGVTQVLSLTHCHCLIRTKHSKTVVDQRSYIQKAEEYSSSTPYHKDFYPKIKCWVSDAMDDTLDVNTSNYVFVGLSKRTEQSPAHVERSGIGMM